MSLPELKKHYIETVVPALMKSRGYENRHEVPGLSKVVLNSGVGSQHDKNVVEETAKDLGLITGQKPIVTKARLSVSNFKLRAGMPVGAKVTLRGNSMYEFLHRLIAVALPGIRDFRGISNKLDGNGNYNLGIEENTIFPEISLEGAKRHMGMDICIVTSAATDAEGFELLQLLGLPFRRKEKAAAAEPVPDPGAGAEATATATTGAAATTG